MSHPADVIDHLAEIAPGSALDRLRAERAEARNQAQASFTALFAPQNPGSLSLEARYALAAFTAGLHQVAPVADFYLVELKRLAPTLAAAVALELAAARTEGPYGAYPAGPLSAENEPGLDYRVTAGGRGLIGDGLAAGFEHVHFLVFHPRDASPAKLQKLTNAGWEPDAIVTLSQLVAFLAFQIRTITGLRALAVA